MARPASRPAHRLRSTPPAKPPSSRRTAKPLPAAPAPAANDTSKGPAGLQALLDGLSRLLARHDPDAMSGPAAATWRALAAVMDGADLYRFAPPGTATLDTLRPPAGPLAGRTVVGLVVGRAGPLTLLDLVADLEALAERYPDAAEVSGPLHEVLVTLEAVELLARRSLEAPAGQRLRLKRSPDAFTLRLGRAAPDSPLEPTHRALVVSTLEGFEHLSEAQEYLGQIVQLLAPSRDGFEVEASELADLDDAAARMTAALSMVSSALATTAARLTGEAAHRSAVTHVRALEHLRTLSADLVQVEGYRRVALPDARRAFDSDAP